MLRIEAEWALWGKPPGERDDYSVLACGKGRLSAAQFETIIKRYSPGNPDTPDALPRVTVSWISSDSEPQLGIAIQTWSSVGDKDGVGRNIAETRYFCVPYEPLRTHPVSYRGLYEALKDQRPTASDHGLVEVDVPGLDPGRLAADISDLGERTVRETAALLLEVRHAVCVLKADQVSPIDRLRFLDAVVALLPYGYRTRLTASTWSNSASPHRIRLSFAKRARESAHAVVWKGRAPDPYGEPAAGRYIRLLDGLAERQIGSADIVRALAAETEPQLFKDPDPALRALARIDMAHVLLEQIREHSADPDEVRELFDKEGRLADLEPAEQREVLAYLIGLRTPQDWDRIERWWPRLAEGDSGHLVGTLTKAARRQVWTPDSLQVKEYVLLAERHGLGDRFLAGLVLPPDRPQELEGGLRTASQLLYEYVVASKDTGNYGETLRALSRNPSLVYELLAQLTGERATHLKTGLAWLDPGKGPLLRPFRTVVEAGQPVSRDDVEQLAAEGRNCVRALLKTAADKKRLDLVLIAFAHWLNTRPLQVEERKYWAVRLADLHPQDIRMRGAVDVLLLVTDLSAISMPDVSARNWPDYADAFLSFWALGWTDEHRSRMVDALRKQLQGLYWDGHRGRRDGVTQLVERLVEVSARSSGAALRDALREGVAEIDLSADPQTGTWLQDHFGDRRPPATSQPGRAKPALPVRREEADPVVELCITRWRQRRTPDQVCQELVERQAITSAATALLTVNRVRDGLIQAGAQSVDADRWGVRLAAYIGAGRFGSQVAADFRRETFGRVPDDVVFWLTVLEASARCGKDNSLELTDPVRSRLLQAKSYIDQLHKESKRGGFRKRISGLFGDDDEEEWES